MLSVQEFCDKYYIERKGTGSLKWDALEARFGDPDLISMWVADMEFRAPEAIIDALHERVAHGAYGYSYVPDSYYEAFIEWEKSHYGYAIEKDWIRISPGIVAALYWMVNAFTEENDSVVILTPVYYPFHNCVTDNNRNLVTCDLVYKDGVYTVDYDAFEKAIVDNKVKMHIMSSPHNPAGRVWTEEELDKMLDICTRHGVLVISDEIHQDLVAPGHKHIPSAIVSGGKYAQNIITANAPSKTFNLATCLTSNIVIENPALRETYDAFMKRYNQIEVNVFGLAAAEAAYREGEDWRQSLVNLIFTNYEYVKSELAEIPAATVTPLEGTYLMWIDLRSFVKPEDMKEFVQDKCRLAVDYGEWFGKNWAGFIRLNLATHPDIVKQAVENIKENLRKLG